jgi:hypothetical protein
MLCSEIGGEGHNLQFANTLINFDSVDRCESSSG